MGLFLGVSFLSFIELVEILIVAFIISCSSESEIEKDANDIEKTKEANLFSTSSLDFSEMMND